MSNPVNGFTVLVSDVDLRKSFDAVSSLRREGGYRLALASAVPGPWGAWVYGCAVSRLRKGTPADFAADLERIEPQAAPVTFLPVEEDTTRLFLGHVASRPGHRYRYLLPTPEQFELARDKKALSAFCRQHGIPAPRVLSSADLESGGVAPDGVWVVKPKRGMGARGVRYVSGLDGLRRLGPSVFDDAVVQERIGDPRAVEGAFVLCRDGAVVDFYSHERLRTAPESGGVSVLSVTRNNPRLLETVAPLALALRWNGLMMVELIHDPRDDRYKVIEINPRLWGSVLLAEFSGSRILHNYLRLANGLAPERTFASAAGRRLRWVVPHDVIHFLRRLGRVPGFWRRGHGDTCYVNVTFARRFRALCFHVFLALDLVRRRGRRPVADG